MKSYRVLQACGFTKGGKGVTSSWPGTIVQVNDSEAEALVAEGKLEPVEPETEVVDPEVVVEPEGDASASRSKSKAD